ncbi:hypothetical protein SAMN05216582_10369 [Selenomonas ruminantium]|uniref:Uncharacterized protein n=1 Tax=Selenomonas ruminantium TaxID=971 RepID=A0A1M6S213_SELRU|nr:hypothetical protein SAMN05216582_10369 [Selenomonas ruminantium]
MDNNPTSFGRIFYSLFSHFPWCYTDRSFSFCYFSTQRNRVTRYQSLPPPQIHIPTTNVINSFFFTILLAPLQLPFCITAMLTSFSCTLHYSANFRKSPFLYQKACHTSYFCIIISPSGFHSQRANFQLVLISVDISLASHGHYTSLPATLLQLRASKVEEGR